MSVTTNKLGQTGLAGQGQLSYRKRAKRGVGVLMCPIDKFRARAFGPAPALRSGASARMPGLAGVEPPRPPVHAGACPRMGGTSPGSHAKTKRGVLTTRSDNQSYVTSAAALRPGDMPASLPLADLNNEGLYWGSTPAPGEYVDNYQLIFNIRVYRLSPVKEALKGGAFL